MGLHREKRIKELSVSADTTVEDFPASPLLFSNFGFIFRYRIQHGGLLVFKEKKTYTREKGVMEAYSSASMIEGFFAHLLKFSIEDGIEPSGKTTFSIIASLCNAHGRITPEWPPLPPATTI